MSLDGAVAGNVVKSYHGCAANSLILQKKPTGSDFSPTHDCGCNVLQSVQHGWLRRDRQRADAKAVLGNDHDCAGGEGVSRIRKDGG